MSRSLAKNATFNVIYKGINVLFPLISSAYIARILMPAGVGKVAFAQNIVSYFISFANFGIPTYGTRLIAQNRNSRDDRNKAFSELLLLNAFSTTICLAVYLTMILSAGLFREYRILHLVFTLQLVFNYIDIDWLYQGMEEYQYIAVRNIVVKVCSIASLFIFVRELDDYLKYAFILVFASGANHLFNILNSRKFVRLKLKGLKVFSHVRAVAVFFVCFIALDLYAKIDTTMLGVMCSEDVVGYYANAQKLVNAVVSLTTAISSIFFPRLSLLFKEDRNEYNKLATTGTKLVFFLAMPCFVGLELVADQFVPLFFGSAFLPAILTVRSLAVLVFLKSIGDILCYQVVMSSGNEKKYMVIFMFAALLNVVLNRLFIPRGLQNGAALASVMSECFVDALLLSVAFKVVKLDIKMRFILTEALSILAMSLAVLVLKAVLDVNPVVKLAAEVVVATGIYGMVNIVLKNDILSGAIDMVKSKLKRD